VENLNSEKQINYLLKKHITDKEIFELIEQLISLKKDIKN